VESPDGRSRFVPLPETIPVKYTEEEAEYVSIRPVVRQSFRAAELIDMILGVTGKDLSRIQQILRSGTVVFHSYRYWWEGFEADAAALEQILAHYPDQDSSRPFRAEDCSEAILESSGSAARHTLRLRRDAAGKRKLLRARSLWDCLMNLTRDTAPAYREYSYALRGDLYSMSLSPSQVEQLARDASQYAPRTLRAELAILPEIARITFICPRTGSRELTS
jgi:hypothetical protein